MSAPAPASPAQAQKPRPPSGCWSTPSAIRLCERDVRAPNPAFPTDWAARQASFGDGFTVIRTPQCPYIDDATADLLQIAAERGIPARAVELTSAQEAQSLSPSPYGTFGIVRDGRLFSYHYLCRKELEKLLAE